MSKAFSIDPTLGKLNVALSNESSTASEIVPLLQQLRSSVSCHWFESFVEYEPTKCLTDIWSLLFKFTGHEDTLVRLNSYSVLGAIVTTVCPIFPKMASTSFSAAVLGIEVSPNVSIAVISCFTYLVHFISPAEVDDFILNTPVLHHFSTDVSQFISHLPHIIRLMHPLEKQFHQNLLRSLCISFGRQPNHSFVEAVTALIEMNPRVLINDIMEFSKANSLSQIVLSVGPDALNNDKIYREVVESGFIEDFLNVSIEKLLSDSPPLTDFECACSTLALIARKSPEFVNKITEAAAKAKIPKHFRKFLLLLPVPIEQLYLEDNDASSLVVTKLRALPDFLKRNGDDKESKLKVIDILEKALMSGKKEAFSALCDSLAACFPLLINTDDNKLKEIIKGTLEFESANWVQKEALVRLFDAINVDSCMKIIPGYQNIVVKTLFEFCLASNESLSDSAAKTLVKVITYDTLNIVVDHIRSIDLFSSDECYKVIRLLNSFVDVFGDKPFINELPIIMEIIEYHDTLSICSEGYLLLSKFPNRKVSNEMIMRAADWLNAIFKSFMQNDMVMSFDFHPIEVLPFLSTIETDVVANVLPLPQKAIPGVLNLFKFLVSTETVNIKVLQVFAVQLIKLFPKEIVDIASRILDPSSQEFIGFSQHVVNIMQWNCSVETAASFCKFLVNAPRLIIDIATKTVSSLIESHRVKSGDHLFSMFTLLNKYQPDLAEEMLAKAREGMDDVQNLLFDIKKGDTEKMNEFISNNNFEDMPLYDVDFLKYISRNEVDFRGKISDFSKINDSQWKFIINHKEIFSGIDEYIEQNRYKMSRFIKSKEEEKKLSIDYSEDVIKSSSLAPDLLSGSLSFNIPLLSDYFEFSNTRIDSKLVCNLLHETVERINEKGAKKLSAFIVSYANKYKIAINKEDALILLEQNNTKINRSLIRQLSDNKVEGALKKACEILGINEGDSIIDKLSFTNDCTLYDIAFYLDIDRQVESALSTRVNSNKGLRMITNCVERFEISANILMTIGDRVIERIADIAEKSKKLQRALRLICLIFYRLKFVKKEDERNIAKEFCKRTISSLLFLKVTDNASIHSEMSNILYQSMNIVAPTQEVLDYLVAVDQDFGQKNPYIAPIFALLVLTGINLSRATRTTVTALAESEQQSDKIQALRILLDCVAGKGAPNAFQIFSSYVVYFFRLIENNISWPVPEVSSAIIKRAIVHPNFNSIKDTFIRQALPIALAPYDSPSIASYSAIFGDVLQVIVPPQLSVTEYAEKLPRSYPSHPYLMNIYKSYTAWLLKFTDNEDESGNIWLEAVNAHQKVFLASPSLESASALADVISARFDATEAAFLLVGRLAMMPNSFIWTYLVIFLYLGRQDDEALNTIIGLADDVAPSFPAKERLDALKELAAGNVLKGALIASSC